MPFNVNLGPAVTITLTQVAFLAMSACHTRTENPTTGLDSLAKVVLHAARTRNVSGLVNSTVGPRDIEEVTRKLREFGWHPQVQLESEKQSWLSLATSDASVFLASYEDLFQGEAAVVVSVPIDLSGSTVETPHGPQDGFAIYGHLEPRRVIIWVRNGRGFSGLYLPEVYKLGSRLKVNSWVTGSARRFAEGELLTERAILNANDLNSCDFPAQIQFRRAFRQ